MGGNFRADLREGKAMLVGPGILMESTNTSTSTSDHETPTDGRAMVLHPRRVAGVMERLILVSPPGTGIVKIVVKVVHPPAEVLELGLDRADRQHVRIQA
jgi:hypothetical protein